MAWQWPSCSLRGWGGVEEGVGRGLLGPHTQGSHLQGYLPSSPAGRSSAPPSRSALTSTPPYPASLQQGGPGAPGCGLLIVIKSALARRQSCLGRKLAVGGGGLLSTTSLIPHLGAQRAAAASQPEPGGTVHIVGGCNPTLPPPPVALSPVFLEGQSHVLLHLLQAVVVGVDEVERQGHGERAVPPAWRHP